MGYGASLRGLEYFLLLILETMSVRSGVLERMMVRSGMDHRDHLIECPSLRDGKLRPGRGGVPV